MTTEAVSTATGQLQNLTGVITLKLRTPSRLRNLELVLLLFAIAINAGSFVLVQFGVLGEIEPGMLSASFVLAGLALAMHVALRISAPDADPLILPIATVLNGTGLAMIYRLDLAKGFEGWGAASVRQIVWTTLAVIVATVVLAGLRNYRVLQRFTYLAMFSAIVLLLLPLVPGLARTDDVAAKVWIDVAGFSFQPGEIAKIALGVFFAGYLVQHRDSLAVGGRKLLGMRLPRIRDLGPILLIWAAAMGVLVFQRDLGTSLLYFGLFLVMIYVATGRLSWVLLGLGLFVGGGAVASQTLGYVNDRFTVWLDAFNPEYANGVAYQLVQGIFGIAQGGMVGTGLGQGRPNIVPLAESDFIIASLGEELGLAGLFALLALYLLLVSRGFRIGFAGRDDFGRLLAVGLSFVVALQVFIVIGGVTRVIPLTGLTTPFLAAGGSSLIANWIIVAILLRLSDAVRNQPRLVVGP